MGILTTGFVVTHETSASKTSNTVHHWLKVGSESYCFDEDTKVSIYLVGKNQFPRLEDAMLRALLLFRNEISSRSTLGETGEEILTAIDREIDRQMVVKRRMK